ncbi:PREDICTED: uncharacterized protein LOC109325237 [Lupinus angustifolius]|uniref:uncharacterized protein LOC109325237 n=1 Tax=Lupinus angustifolius TaxID=3871 RepID=UPI00092F1EB7|nr:PREDICTED: uncharacterized protein LOC109325237 [Lupinus angustifolius]
MKLLRSDGGGKYNSHKFHHFCEKEGIPHEVIAPYTPQHNGANERVNRDALNMTRSMLKTKKLPKRFWTEAVSTTAYILNRCPTKRLANPTMEEAWSGLKPNVKHLKVFGSVFNLETHTISYCRDLKFNEAQFWDWNEHSVGSNRLVRMDIDNTQSTPEVQTISENNVNIVERQQRQRHMPSRFSDYELFDDSTITREGDLVHMALLAEMEPISFDQAIKES